MDITLQIINVLSGDVLRGILELEKRVYPLDWQFEDAKRYFEDKLIDSRNVNIILKSDNGMIVGYALAVPHNIALEEIKEDDPDMLDIKECFYIEAFELDPCFQKFKMFSPLLESLIGESKRRGAKKLSMHARVSVGASSIIKKSFRGKILTVRRIDNWVNYAEQESTDYIVVDCA